ncbi:hypothetical protein FJT64_022475 [Amphibalanus amphitrite]|uniref:C2H2-type domain-containing protein n=1 Tax=Amphibalanus amphitrite TaxID=1232801 RepID=A0A6A4WV58_AMPAM|nr:hypothetical protein FJT64_022475 [Amphibalanus amphitrite]
MAQAGKVDGRVRETPVPLYELRQYEATYATKARCKVEVDDPRRPGRTKFRYIYDDEFHCEICGKAFAWRGHLVKHMQVKKWAD